MMMTDVYPPSMAHLIALVLTLCCAISWAATITGYGVAVADGDTITVLDVDKTPLAEIDAVETSCPSAWQWLCNCAVPASP